MLSIVVICAFVVFIAIIIILMIPRIIYGKMIYNVNKKSDCIIILGYRAPADGIPSPILIERIRKGIELYRLNVAQKIICAGGAVKNQHIEAEVIFKELVKNGIPEENIICERASKGTWGNIKNSKIIMNNHGFKNAVIVSSPWHLRRASIYAAEMGIEHTVEKSDIPKGSLRVFLGIAYIYIYYGIIKYLLNKHKYLK